MIKELIQSIRSLECLSQSRLWLAIGFSVLSAAIILPVGVLVQLIFDRALPASDFMLLIALGGTAITLIIVNGFLSVTARNSIVQITKTEILKIRTKLIHQLLQSSHRFSLQADLSKLHKTAVYDTEKIDALLNSFFSILIPSSIVSILLIGALFFLDWQMGLGLILLGIISAVIVRSLRRNGKETLIAFQKMFEAFHQHTLFILEYHKLIKSSSTQNSELLQHGRIVERLNLSNQKMVEGFTKLGNYQELVFSTSSILLLILGGHRVMQGALTIGTLISFYFCLYLLKRYFTNISNAIPVLIEGSYSFIQYRNILNNTEPEPYSGKKTLAFTGNISVNQITFAFASKTLFENFNMILKPGTVTLLSGPNGSGKSTLIHILLGFYKPTNGTILADHLSYEELDISAYRNQISVLFQENLVFNGTISENIRYGYPDASEAEIDAAINSATLNEFIATLPNGKDSDVGDKGMKLSGGQRQKIGLARCFLSKAPLIIMDEPTNHLDQQTIQNFIRHIKNINHQPALLMVSHDEILTTIANQVYYLKNH